MGFSSASTEDRTLNFDFTFNTDESGWVGDFADYPVGDEEFFELDFSLSTLPKPIPSSNSALSHGLHLTGNNHSDDLFMYVKREIEGLEPDTLYALTFTLIFENNIFPGQYGIGGSPGESVYVKVGASAEEPDKVDVNGYYLMNIDKGDQAMEGANSQVVGTLSNALVNGEDPQYEPIGYLNPSPLKVRTDPEGRLWLFVGTDSGFEGPTHFYIARIAVNAEQIPE